MLFAYFSLTLWLQWKVKQWTADSEFCLKTCNTGSVARVIGLAKEGTIEQSGEVVRNEVGGGELMVSPTLPSEVPSECSLGCPLECSLECSFRVLSRVLP